MRRLTQHVLAAASVSVLTAGAVVGSLTTTALPTESVAVAAPLVFASGAALRSTAPTVDAIALDRRLVRESRANQREQLLTAAAAGVRRQALLEQQHAQAEQQQKLERRAAAGARHRAEQAKKRAEQAKRAEQRKQRAEQAKRAERAKRATTTKAGQGSSASGGSPRAIARRIMSSKYGWGASQFRCYNNIIMRESGWRVHADNPSSSAYGIPQALPGSKMASAGPDWRNNASTQIKWGLGYVHSRYGTPCSAWSFKHSHGWY